MGAEPDQVPIQHARGQPGWVFHAAGPSTVAATGKAPGSEVSGISPLVPCVKQEQGRVWRHRAGNLAETLSWKEAAAGAARGPGLPKGHGPAGHGSLC